VNVLEAATLIDRCIALGIWPHPGDANLIAEQAQAWSEQLSRVPLEFALNEAVTHPGPYNLRPSLIRGAWERAEKARRVNTTYDERACAFARMCRCTHAEGQCNRGFLDTPQDLDRGTVMWCPQCWNARNLKREEQGKSLLELGEVGSHL